MKKLMKRAYSYIGFVTVLCIFCLSASGMRLPDEIATKRNTNTNDIKSEFPSPTLMQIDPSVYPSNCLTYKCLTPDINSLPDVISLDTFPFLWFRKPKKRNTPIFQDNDTTLFPDSKSYRLPYSCNVTFNGKDPLTGERKKELGYEPLFSFTSPHLKPYLPGRDLLQAEGSLIKFSGGYTYLSVRFQWNAKDPNKAYGRLKASGAIRCHLTGDKSVTLYNERESLWQMNDDPASHKLQATFLIHPKQIRLLKKYPVMQVTVFWERGYEVYPIYPITIFMDQLKCLE